jgi:hypothetical protein
MDFVDQYISEHNLPIKAAKNELLQIDNEIKRIHELEVQRFNIVKVLDFFGDDSYKKKKAPSKIISDDVVENCDFDQKILEVLQGKELSIRDLLNEIGVFDTNPIALRSIKKLAENKKISRTSHDKLCLISE